MCARCSVARPGFDDAGETERIVVSTKTFDQERTDKEMSNLPIDRQEFEDQIMAMATQFAREVVALISSATVDDLMNVANRGGGALAAGPVPYPHLTSTAGVLAPVRRKRRWPTCGEPNCKNSYYPASGTARLCYQHFLASGGRHPSKRK